MANLIADTFRTWDAMPQHLVIQSWVVTPTGLFITPTNLPEDRLYTHTNLVWQLFRRLRGSKGGILARRSPKWPVAGRGRVGQGSNLNAQFTS